MVVLAVDYESREEVVAVGDVSGKVVFRYFFCAINISLLYDRMDATFMCLVINIMFSIRDLHYPFC